MSATPLNLYQNDSDRKVTMTASNNDSVQPLSRAAKLVLSERALTGKPQDLPLSTETLAWFKGMTDSHRRMHRNEEVRQAVAKRLS